MIRFKFTTGRDHETVSFSLYVNMDETEVFFEARPKFTVHVVEENKVSIRCTGSSNRRMIVCVSVACDDTKLLLFFILRS